MTLDAPPIFWWKTPIPRGLKACYPTKTAALVVFADANRDLIQNYGGMNYGVSPSEFDSINHKYSLRGKQAARSIADALWAALPAQKRPPFCLEDIDIDALNDTSPAREYALGFRLPDWAEEDRLVREQEAWYRDEGMAGKSWTRRSPKTKAARRALLDRCGRNAFLEPDKLKFPIMSKGSTACEPDCRGLLAAKQRAAQQGKRKLVSKANQIGRLMSCSWAK